MTGAAVSLTFTVNSQRAMLPRSSVARQVTGVIPRWKALPEGGVHVTVTMRAQVVRAVTVKSATAPFVPAHSTTTLVGQLMVMQPLVVWAGAWTAANPIAAKVSRANDFIWVIILLMDFALNERKFPGVTRHPVATARTHGGFGSAVTERTVEVTTSQSRVLRFMGAWLPAARQTSQ
jgi:hypothetical protein